DAGDAVADYQAGPHPDPDITAGPDDEVTRPTDEEAARADIPAPTGANLPAQAARALVHDRPRPPAELGKPTRPAGAPEPLPVGDATGNRSRGWTYKVVRELVDLGVLEEDDSDSTTRYTSVDLAPVDDREPVTV